VKLGEFNSLLKSIEKETRMNWKRQRILKRIQRNYKYSAVVSQKGSQYYVAIDFFSELLDELILTAGIWLAMGIIIFWT
jgi:hypothetical protein